MVYSKIPQFLPPDTLYNSTATLCFPKGSAMRITICVMFSCLWLLVLQLHIENTYWGKNRVSKIAVLDEQMQLFCGQKPEMNKRQHLHRIIHVSCLQPIAALKAAVDGQRRPMCGKPVYAVLLYKRLSIQRQKASTI